MEGFQKQASLLRKKPRAQRLSQVCSPLPCPCQRAPCGRECQQPSGLAFWNSFMGVLELVRGSLPGHTNAGLCHSLQALTPPPPAAKLPSRRGETQILPHLDFCLRLDWMAAELLVCVCGLNLTYSKLCIDYEDSRRWGNKTYVYSFIS